MTAIAESIAMNWLVGVLLRILRYDTITTRYFHTQVIIVEALWEKRNLERHSYDFEEKKTNWVDWALSQHFFRLLENDKNV